MRKQNYLIDDKEFIFIIGSLKSGTTWLQILLTAHPNVIGTVELSLFNNYISPLIKAWTLESANIINQKWVKGLPFIMKEKDFYDLLNDFICKAYENVLALSPEATHIIDKDPAYSFVLKEIELFFPNAKFIHIIRDGRDVSSSLMHVNKHIGYGAVSITEAALKWKSSIEAAYKGKKNKDRYLEIRYEELLENSKKTLTKVYEFCGLKVNPSEVEEIVEEHNFTKMKAKRQHMDKRAKTHPAFYRKGISGGWKEEFSFKDKYLFHKNAGDLLINLGYAEEGWWYRSRFQKHLFPHLLSISYFFKKVLKLARLN